MEKDKEMDYTDNEQKNNDEEKGSVNSQAHEIKKDNMKEKEPMDKNKQEDKSPEEKEKEEKVKREYSEPIEPQAIEERENKTYESPRLFSQILDKGKEYGQITDKISSIEKRIQIIERHAKTDYKFLAYMALIIAALSICFSVYLYNRTISFNNRLNRNIETVMRNEAEYKQYIAGIEDRLARTEIDYNRYIENHLNEYLNETIIKLNTIKRILDTQKQEELEMIIDQIQNIKNGVDMQ